LPRSAPSPKDLVSQQLTRFTQVEGADAFMESISAHFSSIWILEGFHDPCSLSHFPPRRTSFN